MRETKLKMGIIWKDITECGKKGVYAAQADFQTVTLCHLLVKVVAVYTGLAIVNW